MLLPRSTADQAFIIRNIVRPIYPVDATEAERRRPEIVVRSAVDVRRAGVTAAVPPSPHPEPALALLSATLPDGAASEGAAVPTAGGPWPPLWLVAAAMAGL